MCSYNKDEKIKGDRNMSEKNIIHYSGSVAKWYDFLLTDQREDIEFLKTLINTNDGPVLDIGCGTGRLMLPLARQGVEIDGLDASNDMLKICREKFNKEGLKTTLYTKKFQSFDTEKKYKTIYCAGNIQFIDSFFQTLMALQNIHSSLQKDGKLIIIMSFVMPVCEPSDRGIWKVGKTFQDDSYKVIYYHNCEIDEFEQLVITRNRYEIFENDTKIETIKNESVMRWYGRYEFLLMLEKSGFKNISITNEDIFNTGTPTRIYTAYK